MKNRCNDLLLQREFGLTPSSGLILPFGSQPVRVDFIASSQQSYNYSLHVDAEGIGAALLRLPIKARCEVHLSLTSQSAFLPEFILEMLNLLCRCRLCR